MSAIEKVAVITGASRGIGAATITAFRELGYGVVAVSRSIQPDSDPDILTVAGDIGDPAVGRRAIERGRALRGVSTR